jgi:hypothetical protein
MEGRCKGDDSGDAGVMGFLGGEQQCHSATHARAKDGGLAGLANLDDFIRGLKIFNFAAVSNVGKITAGFTDLTKVEAQG